MKKKTLTCLTLLMKVTSNCSDLTYQNAISPAPRCHTAQMSQAASCSHCHFVSSLSQLHATTKMKLVKVLTLSTNLFCYTT